MVNTESKKTEITLQDLYAAKSSINGRLCRLEKTYSRFGNSKKSPIKRIGVFINEIQKMKTILESMEERLDNAKITIEI